MAAKLLTKRQEAVYLFVKEQICVRGVGPTVREICEEFGINSPNGVICHLKSLEKKGLIRRAANKSRSIELVGGPMAHQGLPLKGFVAAGLLHTSITEEGERIAFTQVFDAPGRYVLRIQGDSMIDAHIMDGDFVVVSPADDAANGEIVVAQTDNGETTLKYWFREKGRVRLQPANAAMKPMYLRKVKVLGKVIGVVRPC